LGAPYFVADLPITPYRFILIVMPKRTARVNPAEKQTDTPKAAIASLLSAPAGSSLWQKSRESMGRSTARGPRRRDEAVLAEIRASLDNEGPGAGMPAATARLLPQAARPSALLDTRVVYCGDCLEQLRKLPDACVDLIYIDPPFNSNRNYEVFWGETKEKRAFFAP
jgi:hypothetical protein